MKTIDLGEIKLSSRIKITDPCYLAEEWCCNEAYILPGIYKCEAVEKYCGDWGNRISELRIRHIDYPDVMCLEIFPWSVEVDSGQAGFFDDAFYQNDTVFEELPAPGFAIGDLWYRHVCDITLSKMSAGVLPYGAVSSSGFGDGGYTCYTHADENGVIDFAFIVFI